MHYVLGCLSEFNEKTSKSFSLNINQKSLSLFVIRHNDEFFAYENSCPHTGVNLNWQPDQFLDITEQHIQCSTHGALFRINDGVCEWGPCLGQRLRSLTIDIHEGDLILVENSLPHDQSPL